MKLMKKISSTALISSSSVITAEDIYIGERVNIGENVQLNCRKVIIEDHTCIESDTIVNVETLFIGKYNRIEKCVKIIPFKKQQAKSFSMGDCNFIGENTRFVLNEFSCGDYNVIHNSNSFIGQKPCSLGHNCWIGQNCVLDSTDFLTLGNGVRMGYGSQIWTHVASGELIEGCQLFNMKPTRIEDEVWLVGGHIIVSPGLVLKYRSVVLTGAVVTHNTEPYKCYGGIPARDMSEKIKAYISTTLDEKFEKMKDYVKAFVETYPQYQFQINEEKITVSNIKELSEPCIWIYKSCSPERMQSECTNTIFDLKTKTYTKRLTHLERKFYEYIYNHKARFIPMPMK